MMLDALADGGVYAGIPKDIGLKLIAYTMMVTKQIRPRELVYHMYQEAFFCYRVQLRWF